MVGYIIDRVSNLCIPCCVKEKINNAIITYANNILAPISDNIGLFANTEVFTSFCDTSDEMPKYGPIYIANIVVVDENGIPINTLVPNSIIDVLQMIKFYIRSYFSTRCCCRIKHPCVCSCNMTYNDACKFVFGRFCVVDIKIPAIIT